MTLRFGLVGYGLWGRHHARAIANAPGATLGAIACRTPETAEAARRDWPDATVELDYRTLLARGDIDAVDIVVPNDLHEEIGVAALEAGKDVLLEKPLAPTLAACDRLIVGLNSDASVKRLKGDGRPMQEVHARAEVLAALEAVDLVVVFDQDTPLELLRRVRPKVLAKGGDYSHDQVVGHELVESDGGEVILIDLVPGFSTTEIVRKSRAPQPS